MKKMFVAIMAICLYQMNAAVAAPAPTFDVPAECKNLALMQGQLLTTYFRSNVMGKAYNPPTLTLKTRNGLSIGKIEYLGGDSQDQAGPNAGKYPCNLDKSLCLSPADAGGAIDWARVTVTTSNATPSDVAQVVVSMGSRGGCVINSSTLVTQ